MRERPARWLVKALSVNAQAAEVRLFKALYSVEHCIALPNVETTLTRNVKGRALKSAFGVRTEPLNGHQQEPTMAKPKAPLQALDAIADKVLRYRPKPKSKPARSRQRRKAKLEKSK